MRNFLKFIKKNEGTSLVEILIVTIIVFTVMVASGIFSPPRSPVTDKREGEVIDDGATSQKRSLNIKDLKIKLSNATPTPPEEEAPPEDTTTPSPSITPTSAIKPTP